MLNSCDRMRDEVWDALIQPLHAAGYHHHDIWERNILQDMEGRLCLIDLESAIPAEECRDKRCPDHDWKPTSLTRT